MEYLIKVSAVVSIFYFCYKIFLQRDTFFESNRWFLLFGLITAFIIPYFVIPIYIEAVPVNTQNFIFDEIISNQPIQQNSFDWSTFFLSLYILGLIFFSIRFIIQFFSLINIIVRNKGKRKGYYTFIKTDESISPFSFFNRIVYNPQNYSDEELDLIITHEKVHARQYHSLDVLLTQLCCIVLWFNPFIWLYNKDLKQNLEFIADKDAQQMSSCKKSYQYTLLKTSMPTHQLALSNNFYNSLIKKRIVMLQKSKSKKINRIKYTLVIPLLAIFLMSFNTKTIFIEKENPLPVIKNHKINTESMAPSIELKDSENDLLEDKKIKSGNVLKPKSKNSKTAQPTTNSPQTLKDVYEFLITKNSTDTEIDKLVSKAQAKGVTIKVKSIKRNSKSEIISIKIEAKGKNSNASFNLNSDEAIDPIKISFEDKGKNISIGNTSSKHRFHKTEKGHNVFVITDYDDEQEIIHEIHGDSSHHYTFATTKGKHHIVGKNKKVEIIHNDEDEEVIEVIVDDDNTNDEDVIILKNSASSSSGSTGKSYKVKTIGKGHEDSKIIIKSDDNSEPLFIVDGKEQKTSNIDDLNPDDIESINVLKGKSADKKYGDKGKNGVVEITTKKK